MPPPGPLFRALAVLLAAGFLAPGAAFAQDQPAAESAGGDAADTGGGDLEAVMAEGEELYLEVCRRCHGTHGTAGVPLAGNDKLASFGYLGYVIITGPGYMPELGNVLTDEQIAAISTYVMNSWGHGDGLVTPEDVAALR